MWPEKAKQECLLDLQEAEGLLLSTRQKLSLGTLTREEFRELVMDVSDRLAHANWTAGLDESWWSDK